VEPDIGPSLPGSSANTCRNGNSTYQNMAPVSSITRLSRRSRRSAACFCFDLLTLEQLIKQLSATPILLPQNAVNNPPETLDPQAMLQANKATFFFRLVWKNLFDIESESAYSHPFSGTRARKSQCILPAEGGRGLPYDIHLTGTWA